MKKLDYDLYFKGNPNTKDTNNIVVDGVLEADAKLTKITSAKLNGKELIDGAGSGEDLYSTLSLLGLQSSSITTYALAGASGTYPIKDIFLRAYSGPDPGTQELGPCTDEEINAICSLLNGGQKTLDEDMVTFYKLSLADVTEQIYEVVVNYGQDNKCHMTFDSLETEENVQFPITPDTEVKLVMYH